MMTDSGASQTSDSTTIKPQNQFVALPKRTVTLSLVCVLLAMLLAALSQTVVATILPLMVADIGGFERYTWAATSYLVAATIAYPIVGRLSDIYGRKRFLVTGMLIFMVGSILVGSSTSMNQVIGFRAIQGLGGGIMITCCYVAIADLFPPEERGKYHGLISAVYGVASVIGPVLGGVVVEGLSWQWVFILLGIASFPVFVLSARIYPSQRKIPGKVPFDLFGMLLLVLAVVPIFFALSSGGIQYAWDSPQIIGPLAFGIAMGIVFVILEARVSEPIMPLAIYANRVVSLAVLVTLLTSLGLYGSVIFLPLFFQGILGVSATTSGNLLVPMLLGMVIGGIIAGQLLSRAGGHYQRQVLVSTGLMTIGMFLLITMDASTSLIVAICYILIAGLGFGGVVATLSVAVQNHVSFSLVGAATSALQFFRSLGGMLGLSILGALLARSFYVTLNETIPDHVREALPEGTLDALKNRLTTLDNQIVTESLEIPIDQPGLDGNALTNSLSDSFSISLATALNHVFFVVAVLTALSFVSALFLRVPKDPPVSQDVT